MNNNLEIIYRYKEVLANIDTYISRSPYKREFIMDRLGLKRSTFYKKLKGKKFSVDEIENLAEMLWPDQVNQAREKKLDELLERGKKDIQEGRVYSHREAMKEVSALLERQL